MRKHTIGIIAEDNSDVAAIKVIINKLSPSSTNKYHKFAGRGCGSLRKKAKSWAGTLLELGCQVLVIAHDLDSGDYDELHDYLVETASGVPFKHTIICIPIQELEAWFLGENQAINRTYPSLKDRFPIIKNPERIQSPKEHLGRLLKKLSSNRIEYITAHNERIAQNLDLPIVYSTCSSFEKFQNDVLLALT
jgi:hypothetical protein